MSCGAVSRVSVGLLLVWMQACGLLLVSVAGSRVEQDLYSRLTIGYNRQLRPVKRPTEPVRVTLSVSLVEVLGLDENLNHITVKLWVALKWEDAYLKWDPEQHGGVRRLNFATGPTTAKIWTPDIVLHNAIKSECVVDADAVATSDGTVTWVRPFVYTVTSSHEFRGNSWSAAFRFASWTYDSLLVDLHVSQRSAAADGAAGRARNHAETAPIEDDAAGGAQQPTNIKMDTENLMASDQWALLENLGRIETTQYPCCPNEPYTTVSYVLKLRKKIGPSLLGRRGR